MSRPAGERLPEEPTEGLAPLLVRQVGEVIGDLKREGLSILLVEQNLANEDVKSRYLGVS